MLLDNNHHNNNSKNVIIAIILSLVILISWNIFYETPNKKQIILNNDTKTLENKTLIDNNYITPLSNLDKQLNKAKNNNSNKPELYNGVKINNNLIKGTINLKNVIFDNITLLKYRKELKKQQYHNSSLNSIQQENIIDNNTTDSNLIKLLHKANEPNAYFLQIGVISNDNYQSQLPNSQTIWKIKEKQANSNLLNAQKLEEITPENPLILYWINSDNIEFQQIISIDKKYIINVEYKIINNSPNSINISSFGRIQKNLQQSTNSKSQFDKIVSSINNELKETKISKINKKNYKNLHYSGDTKWIGISSKYWLTAIINDQKYLKKNISYRKINSNNGINSQPKVQVSFLSENIFIKANSETSFNYKLFIGPKEFQSLNYYTEKYNLPLFHRAVDFGFIYFIAEPIYKILTRLNEYIGNLGWSIVILTIIFKILLFPLASRSYKEMAKSKKMRPEMLEINKLYKNNRLERGKKLVALNKKYNAKPLFGCLPILIQIPLFFALYRVLLISIEMRHAPFIFWIDDLSFKDTSSIFNLFGLLPFSVPTILQIGLLPILTSLSMFIQNKLNPKPADPMQEKIFFWMPIIFLVIFINLPAGLLIYWIVSNLFTIFQQYIIMKKHS